MVMSDMKCPNCGEEVEILRTRTQKKGRGGLYVTEHPEGTCPPMYFFQGFFDTEKQCKEAYIRFKKDVLERK
jgi:hypothetical protein